MEMGRRAFFFILLLPGLFAQSRPQPARVPASHAGVEHRRTPVAAGRKTPTGTDAEIEARIRTKLAKSKLAADQIRVTVRGGVATIDGETSVIQRKGSATRMARTAGAARVENHIRLSAEARQKAAANLAKGRRRAQVVRSTPRDKR